MCNRSLTAKLLKQDYRYHKLRKAYSKFYRRHFELVSKYNVRLNTLLLHVHVQGLRYKLKRNGYSINVMQHTAFLKFDQDLVKCFAFRWVGNQTP